MAPLVRRAEGVAELTLNQLLRMPRDPAAAAVFGLRTLEQGSRLWKARFREDLAPALLSGAAAHAVAPLPVPRRRRGGPDAGDPGACGRLAGSARRIGGDCPGPDRGHRSARRRDRDRGADRVACGAAAGPGHPAGRGAARALRTGGRQVPGRYRRALESFRFGNAACKVDFILSGPVPWAAPGLADAGTVHVGGTRAETAEAENPRPRPAASRAALRAGLPALALRRRTRPGRPAHPLELLPCSGRLQRGHGDAVMAQLERFAPGFRDLVVGYRVTTAAGLAAYNENYVGGDFAAGRMDLRGLLRRPVLSRVPWRTPLPGVYVCSSSTPPGPGVDRDARLPRGKICPRDIFGLRRARSWESRTRAGLPHSFPAARQPGTASGRGRMEQRWISRRGLGDPGVTRRLE